VLSSHTRRYAVAFIGGTLVTLTMACAVDKPTTLNDRLTFLTRADCVNTPDMAMTTERALDALGWPHDYQVIDIGTLKDTDARTGYPTPTLLWNDEDIFGMPTPSPPFSAPT
jgi:hypothetical protein